MFRLTLSIPLCESEDSEVYVSNYCQATHVKQRARVWLEEYPLVEGPGLRQRLTDSFYQHARSLLARAHPVVN